VRLSQISEVVLHSATRYHQTENGIVNYNGVSCTTKTAVVLVVQRFSVGLVIERSLVRLPDVVQSSQLLLGQLNSAFHPSGVGK